MEEVYSEIVGPMPPSAGKNRYFLTFTEFKSRYRYVYILKDKEETLERFKCYVAAIKNRFGKAPLTLRPDGGGEYCQAEFRRFVEQAGTEHEGTRPSSPPQQGCSEQLNRTLQEMSRSTLMQAGLPDSLWAEAVVAAAYLQNRIPSQVTGETPFELWFGKKASLKQIKAFGAKAYSYVPKEERGKLDPRAEIGIMVGYPSERKEYRVLDPKPLELKCCNVGYVDERTRIQKTLEAMLTPD